MSGAETFPEMAARRLEEMDAIVEELFPAALRKVSKLCDACGWPSERRVSQCEGHPVHRQQPPVSDE